MTTSLAEQLKRLAIPQTKVLVDSKHRPSLLFDPLEAAKLSKDAVFDIGCEGIYELIKIDSSFAEFKERLFSKDAKFMQRAVESKDVNRKLDKIISRFFLRLSPYLLLKSAHKALEWLIFRYQIHELNAEQLFSLILPYHEANIFVRILQLTDLNSTIFKSWTWLEPLQKNGLTLPRRVLLNHAISDTSFLRFICESTDKSLKEHIASDSVPKLRTQLAFFTSALVGIFSTGSTDDHVLTVALPSLLAGLASAVDDFKSASYMALGQLISNNQLEAKLAAELLKKIMGDDNEKFRNQRVYLLLLMFQRQEPAPTLTYELIKDWDWVVSMLGDLSQAGTLVSPLVLAMVQVLLNRIQQEKTNDSAHDASAQIFCWNLIEQVGCDDHSATKLLRMLSSFHEKMLKKGDGRGIKRKKSADAVEEENGQADWLKTLIETLCVKYAAAFDKVIDQDFQSLRRLWVNDEQDRALDGLIIFLVRKCSGPTHSDAWRQLKPLLLKQIDDKRYFKAWCKASPVSEPATLLLILERLLRPIANNVQRKAVLAKVAELPFGSKNACILNLKSTFDNDENVEMEVAMQSMLKIWKSDSSARFDSLKWISAINELRNSSNISSVNDIWPYALQMLISSITSQVKGHTAVELAIALSYVATVKAKKQLALISQLISCVNTFDLNDGWVDLSQPEITICLRIKVLELCLRGVHDSKRSKAQFAERLSTFLQECFPSAEVALNFVGAVAAGLPYQCLTTPLVTPMLQIHSLHHMWEKIQGENSAELVKVWDRFIFHLVLTLCNESMSVRTAAVKLLNSLDGLPFSSKPALHRLISELSSRSKEITADHNHVGVGLFCFLSAKNRKRDTDFLVSALTSPEIPLYVAAKMNYLLETVVSPEFIVKLAPLAQRALESKEDVYIGNKILASYWERLNPDSVEVLEDEVVWGLAKDCLTHQKCDDLCPAIRFIKAVNKDLLVSAPVARQLALLELLVSTRAETESSPVSSAVATTCRKLPLKGSVILPLLDKMVNSLPKTLNATPNTVLEERPWRLGISLLEIIQGKKKIQESKKLVRPLFTLLKFCLDQEEQTPFEYTKQLVLGCLLEICERHLTDAEKIEEAILDVELIVQCLRASSNPQTHHHALLLLSCLAAIIPTQVMHNMMAIFTFMGSSVARLDDEHSVQVVTKVVDAIVPVLVESLSEKTEEDLKVVAEVLRIFVWTLRDVPQHRRTPLFTRLITTLDPDRCLSTFLLLLFENYVVNAHKGEKNSEGNMPASLQLGMDLALSFGPKIVLNTALKLIHYLISIPLEEMNPAREDERMETDENSDGLFDIKKHTPKQLRHFTYTLITFLNSLLADQNLIIQVRELDNNEAENLESLFKEAIGALLLFAPTCSAQQHPTLLKFWKVVTSLSYDVLDRLVALISSDTLVGVITKLLKQSEPALRRKAIDLLNVHVQTHRGGFTVEEKSALNKLVAPVLEVAISLVEDDPTADSQTIQQAALLSLRLLAKVLANEDPSAFKNVLAEVSKLCKSRGFLLASAALTVADLVALIKARAVAELHSFMPPLLKALTKYVDADSTDIVLMSVCAAMYRIVESLAAFLSPYMDKLIYCLSCLATRWPDASDLNRKLVQIRQKLATSVPHRVLSPALTNCYKRLIEEKKFTAVGPLLQLLADSLSAVADVGKLLPGLTPFFFQVLQLRSDAADGLVHVADEEVLCVESHAIDSLMTLVLKLSELSFKPLYYQIFHWVSEHQHRAITFYRLSCKLAEGLKGLFVLFAGHFLLNAASLLDATNMSKTTTPHFGPGPENEARAVLLMESVIKTLQTVFTFDSTQFLSKDKFQALLSPLVDQLENPLGGPEALAERSARLLTPCLAQMTLATDDTQWKQLNYQLLTKTRNSSPLIRIAALNTIVEVATKLGEDYLPLLPETIGTLAELLEDEDERVEEAMKAALRRMEDDLGQPIRDYFQ